MQLTTKECGQRRAPFALLPCANSLTAIHGCADKVKEVDPIVLVAHLSRE